MKIKESLLGLYMYYPHDLTKWVGLWALLKKLLSIYTVHLSGYIHEHWTQSVWKCDHLTCYLMVKLQVLYFVLTLWSSNLSNSKKKIFNAEFKFIYHVPSISSLCCVCSRISNPISGFKISLIWNKNIPVINHVWRNTCKKA